MAIQMRRGAYAQFDPSKMKAGEWAVSTDSDTKKQQIWMCFAPGIVKRMGTVEDFDIEIQRLIQSYLDGMAESVSQAQKSAQTATEKANSASNSASQAQKSASTAVEKANSASGSATQAAKSAQTATQKAAEVAQISEEINTAVSQASSAAKAANEAASNANKATGAAQQATIDATVAKEDADAAAGGANNAALNANDAAQEAREQIDLIKDKANGRGITFSVTSAGLLNVSKED